jgi:hypothetical protein
MRKTLFFLFLLVAFISVSAQDFEGKIQYEVTYTSKSPAMKEEQLRAIMGTQHEYLYKDGNYKTVIAPGAMMQWQLYINADNKLYNQYSNNTTILWSDGAVNADSVLRVAVRKNALEVAGFTCDELTLHCKSGTWRYYYTAQIKASARLFRQHLYGNWYAYLQQSGALPLKYIVDMPQYTIETTAMQVLPMKLEDQLFRLPPDAKTAKSPF